MQQRPYTTQIQEMPFENRRNFVGSIMVGAGSALLLVWLFCHFMGIRQEFVRSLSFIMFCVGLALLLTGLVFLCPRPGTIARMGEVYAISTQPSGMPPVVIPPNPPPPVISGALPTTSDPHLFKVNDYRGTIPSYNDSVRATSQASSEFRNHYHETTLHVPPEGLVRANNRGIKYELDQEPPPYSSTAQEITLRGSYWQRNETTDPNLKRDNV